MKLPKKCNETIPSSSRNAKCLPISTSAITFYDFYCKLQGFSRTSPFMEVAFFELANEVSKIILTYAVA